jgi:hypothetical protein
VNEERAVQTEYIDEQLPFSEDEFYRAFRLVESDREAREGAAFVVQVVRQATEQNEAARLAVAAGSQNSGGVSWVIGDGAFALLALVSEDLRVRVDAYMRTRWEEWREQWLRGGLYRPGGLVLRDPTPEVYAEVEARIAATAAEWSELLERTRADVQSRAGEPVGDEPPPWPGLDNG